MNFHRSRPSLPIILDTGIIPETRKIPKEFYRLNDKEKYNLKKQFNLRDSDIREIDKRFSLFFNAENSRNYRNYRNYDDLDVNRSELIDFLSKYYKELRKVK